MTGGAVLNVSEELLMVLSGESRPMRLVDLADDLGVDVITAGRAAQELVGRGLVKMDRDYRFSYVWDRDKIDITRPGPSRRGWRIILERYETMQKSGIERGELREFCRAWGITIKQLKKRKADD